MFDIKSVIREVNLYCKRLLRNKKISRRTC